jgi:hypothetical protein
MGNPIPELALAPIKLLLDLCSDIPLAAFIICSFSIGFPSEAFCLSVAFHTFPFSLRPFTLVSSLKMTFAFFFSVAFLHLFILINSFSSLFCCLNAHLSILTIQYESVTSKGYMVEAFAKAVAKFIVPDWGTKSTMA